MTIQVVSVDDPFKKPKGIKSPPIRIGDLVELPDGEQCYVIDFVSGYTDYAGKKHDTPLCVVDTKQTGSPSCIFPRWQLKSLGVHCGVGLYGGLECPLCNHPIRLFGEIYWCDALYGSKHSFTVRDIERHIVRQKWFKLEKERLQSVITEYEKFVKINSSEKVITYCQREIDRLTMHLEDMEQFPDCVYEGHRVWDDQMICERCDRPIIG